MNNEISEICLDVLLSGVLTIVSPTMTIDLNNGVVYNNKNKTEYALPDKYNMLELCKSEKRFAVQDKKPFDLVKEID